MNLEIEIKNFYPLENERDDSKGYVKGGLHVAVKIGDVELNIRGILSCKRDGKWFFRMPEKTGKCHKTGKTVMYPILSFGLESELNKVLLDGIFQKAPSFIDAFLVANPQPEPTVHPVQPMPKSKVAAPAKPAPKVFRDLPPRKPAAKSR